MKSFFFQLSGALMLLMSITGLTAASSVSFNVGYDDLTGATNTPPPSVGTYKDLIYNSWGFVSIVGVVGGFAAESKPNVALTSSLIQLMSGTPSFTVAPPYTTAKFQSFYFGCQEQLANSEDVYTDSTRVFGATHAPKCKQLILPTLQANEAVQCTITVAGFIKNSNKEVALASYTFTPPPDLVGQAPMVKAVLPSAFSNVYNVTIIQGNPTTQSLGLDNLTYMVSK